MDLPVNPTVSQILSFLNHCMYPSDVGCGVLVTVHGLNNTGMPVLSAHAHLWWPGVLTIHQSVNDERFQ